MVALREREARRQAIKEEKEYREKHKEPLWTMVEADLIATEYYPHQLQQTNKLFYESHLSVHPLVIMDPITNISNIYLWKETLIGCQ